MLLFCTLSIVYVKQKHDISEAVSASVFSEEARSLANPQLKPVSVTGTTDTLSVFRCAPENTYTIKFKP
jgi:hypothetical protein